MLFYWYVILWVLFFNTFFNDDGSSYVWLRSSMACHSQKIKSMFVVVSCFVVHSHYISRYSILLIDAWQVAWSIAAIYHNSRGEEFRVDPGTLAFSVTLFTIFAFICVATLMYRRRPEIGGELGGPRTAKALTSMLFISLWLLYILFSSLEAYCHIQGF